MKIWKIEYSAIMDKTQPDNWSAIDTLIIAANTIQEAIEKGLKEASKQWNQRTVRVDKAEFALEVNVP